MNNVSVWCRAGRGWPASVESAGPWPTGRHTLTTLAIKRSNLHMRWFAAVIVIFVLIALDRAYMDGQNAALLMSLAQRAAAAINQWADDLMRLIRR
jgi:hypothetical protein